MKRFTLRIFQVESEFVVPSPKALPTLVPIKPQMVLDVVERMAFIALPGKGRQTWLHP